VLEGRVQKIGILYENFAPSAYDPRVFRMADSAIVEAESTKRFENKHSDMNSVAYIVRFGDVTVRPAEKEEVRFV